MVDAEIFGALSLRAAQVLMLARVRAGAEGAEKIDLDHLLAALIMEDQGILLKAMMGYLGLASETEIGRPAPIVPDPFESLRPFLPADLASDLLQRIQASAVTGRQPVDRSTDMPTADPVANTFKVAHDLAKELHHNQVEPLHLLAAALMEESGVGTAALRRAGITAEKVRHAMQGRGTDFA